MIYAPMAPPVLYPQHVGQRCRVLTVHRSIYRDPETGRRWRITVPAPYVIEFPDGGRGIAEESDLKEES